MTDPGPDRDVLAVAIADARVPPQNLDAEESVLGAMMLAANAVDACIDIVRPGDFYRESHGTIYRAIVALSTAGQPIDAITVADRLEKDGLLAQVGGPEKIQELASLVPVAANAAHYARIVHDLATLRGLIRVGHEITRLGFERPGEVPELLEQAEQGVYDLARHGASGDFIAASDAVTEAHRRIVMLHERGDEIVGLPSGFPDIDRLVGGFQPGNLIVIAARPSVGKSGFAFGLAANVALRQGLPVAVLTLEMSRGEVMQRLLSGEAHIESQRLRNGRVQSEEWKRLNVAADAIAKSSLHVDDSAVLTMAEIRSKCRRLKSRNPELACVIVDYLQLIHAKGESRVQEVGAISRALKELARTLEVPVFALSQLSRAVETRHDRRPILSDLRESGNIEQDADLVAFLYRDEIYNPEDPDVSGLAELIVAKHRNGPTGTVRLGFVKRYAQFTTLASTP